MNTVHQALSRFGASPCLRVSVVSACLLLTSIVSAQDLAPAYQAEIQPLLKTYCYECHSGDTLEADLDFAAFTDLASVRKHAKVWLKVADMLASDQMPPPDAKQLAPAEKTKLREWTHRMLLQEAAAHAGDPGPVVLRRLSNAEYTYTIRDLTGVPTLDPAKEFPVDSASGEGFTNVGNSLVMSPALLTKYLDAGKEIASHAVLLPDGVRFSPFNTRRDWTNESLAKIRAFYAQYSGDGGGSAVNLQGIQFSTNTGGRLPVERYLLATIAEREALASGGKSIEAVAKERGLSAKYLRSVWSTLTPSPSPRPSIGAGRGEPAKNLLLEPLREKWKTATPDDLPALVNLITPWQQALFKFNSVGQIGLHPEIKAWQVPVSPLVARQEFKVKLPADATGEIVLSLQSDHAGDGNASDVVLWERPRFTAPGRPDLLLKDVGRVSAELAKSRQRHFSQAAKCLAAAAEAGQASAAVEVAPLATKYGVDADSLAAWLEYLGIGTGGPASIGAAITRKQERAESYDFIKGWVGDDALSVVANSSDQHVRIPGNMKPHSVAVHPAPTIAVAVGWRSPVAAAMKISGLVQHAHPECGNGVGWSLELRRGSTRQRLAAGNSQGATVIPFGPIESVAVRPGDVVALVISPKENNHSCDLTSIDLTLSDGTNEWNLWKDVSPEILAGNPHADSQGRKDVWNFFSEPASGGAGHVIPAGSSLAKWQASSDPAEKTQLAEQVQKDLLADPASFPKDSPDAALAQQLRSISGPFMTAIFSAVASQPAGDASGADSKWGLPANQFGKCPDGRATEAASVCIQAPQTLEFRVPAELVAGAEFTVSGFLHPEIGREGSVRLAVQPGPAGTIPATPIIANEGTATRQSIEAAFDEFRSLFPPTLCYTQIVPVDEVVTLLIYYREDDQLKRLMLTDEQGAQLDKMWDEHFYVAQEPLEMVTAFTQLYQFATQDRADLLPSFEPLRQPVKDKAAAFKQRMIDSEPIQLNAVIAFAGQAWRRPLRGSEESELRSLYAQLRSEELGHEEALRLTLARVLIAPAYLYHIEAPAAGTKASPVSDYELASRLSYFLWSSAPDQELLDLAAAGKLRDPDAVAAQTKRMLKDPRTRRIATEFGCHWLHIHDFENLNEKSERHFPTFNPLRAAMYEESILLLLDLFQNDRSLLSLVDGDATFLNEELAKHYGIPGVEGPHFRRVEGVRQHSRGSVLTLATTLSKQSGASRTSPILRGTWLSEVVLGEKLPKPPKNVPPLAETVTEGLTERQMTQLHSSEPSCAKCHLRVDPFGFALEGFDAIGRFRTQDAAGLPINTKTTLFDGTAIEGLADLKTYIGQTRRDSFVRQFCKRLLGYSLGRAVQLSDEPLLLEMQKQLAGNDYRVGTVIDVIVRSPQFREIRGRDMVDAE